MNTFTITRRELLRFFVWSPAYFAAAMFLFVTGLVFFFTIALYNVATLTYVFHIAAFILLFVAPLLTMRLLSTEMRSGALELLLTTPVHNWEVIVGKFLAAFLLFVFMLIPTLIYPALLLIYHSSDILVTISSYMGLLLLGAMFISLGILTSALTLNPLKAATSAIALSLSFWLIGWPGNMINSFVGNIFTYLSIQEHFKGFILGLITINNIVYFLSIILAALFMATRILEVKRAH